MRAYSGEIDFAAAEILNRNVDYTKLSKEDFFEKKSMLRVQDGALVRVTPKEAMELEYKRSHPHGVIDAVADMPKDVPLIHVLTTTGRIDTYQVVGYGAIMSMPVATRKIPGNPETVYDVPSQNGFDADIEGKTVQQRIDAYLSPDTVRAMLENNAEALKDENITIKDAVPMMLDFMQRLHDLSMLSRLSEDSKGVQEKIKSLLLEDERFILYAGLLTTAEPMVVGKLAEYCV